MKLNLESLVDSEFGISINNFTEEGKQVNEFVKLKDFIDNPNTIETFRFNIRYGGTEVENEVFEHLDQKFFPKIEQIIRKAVRDNTIS